MNVRIDIYNLNRTEARIFNQQLLAFAAAQAMRRMDKYVPFRTGALSQSARQNGNQIEYTTPYAYAMWNGLTPHGNPMHYRKEYHPLATAHWHEAMVNAEGNALAREITRYIRRGYNAQK